MKANLNKSGHQVLVSLKNNKKIINIKSKGTKYTIVKEVALANQYQINEDFYNLLWTDCSLSIKEIKNQPPMTKINHFPEITQITRKNKMASNLNTMRNYFPKEYSFYPQTWTLPTDYHKIMKKHTKGKIYIVKPQNGCQGQGIYLVDNPSKLQYQTNEIVQQYIMDPFLINSLKFDMRIYVLITCINPLRIFIYNDGIVRFATEKFQKAKEANLDNLYSHLTNYAINKHNENFVIDEQNPSLSHKRLFTSVFKNEEFHELMNKISKIVIKTVISGLPFMQNGYSQCKKNDPSSCFQLLGFDVILNSKKEPILLEVNQNPSLVTDTNFDYKLKSQLVQNIFDIISGGYNNLNNEKMELKMKMKDRHENFNKGNFIKIYPCQSFEQTEEYDDFMSKVNMSYRQKFGINVLRSAKKEKEDTKESQQLLSWNDQPSHYTKQKVQKIYGSRNTKTSTFKKRLIFI